MASLSNETIICTNNKFTRRQIQKKKRMKKELEMQSIVFLFSWKCKDSVGVYKMPCCAFSFDSPLSVLKSHCLCILNLYATAVPRKYIVIRMPSTEDSVHYLGLSPAMGPCSHLTKHAIDRNTAFQ